MNNTVKRLLSLFVVIITSLQACQNAVSNEDLRDSIEVIRAADSMLKVDAARDTTG